MSRIFSLTVALLAFAAFAQGEEPRVIVVPVPADPSMQQAPIDAGTPVATPPVEAPPPVPATPPPPTPPAEVPNNGTPTEPPPSDAPRTIEAKPVTAEQLAPVVPVEQPTGDQPVPTTAMLDGHPREGAFLSGPGSLTFVLHHTLMGGVGVLATQMVPRLITAVSIGAPAPFGADDRLADSRQRQRPVDLDRRRSSPRQRVLVSRH